MSSLMLAVATHNLRMEPKLALEAAALRQQLAVLTRKQPRPGSAARTDSSGPRYGDCIRIGLRSTPASIQIAG